MSLKPKDDAVEEETEESDDGVEVGEWYIPKEVKVVRSTHYRHIYGEEYMAKDSWTGIRLNNAAGLNHTIQGNGKYFAIPWQGTAGPVAVFKMDNPRRVPVDTKTIVSGFTVHDFAFHPFNDDLIAIGGDASTVKLFKIPENIEELEENITEAELTLFGHNGKINTLDFHRSANNVLATSSVDGTVKLWDLNTGDEKLSLDIGSGIFKLDFNYTGDLLVVSTKEKEVRIYDPRQKEVLYVYFIFKTHIRLVQILVDLKVVDLYG